MGVVVVCSVLLAAGIAAVVRWGSLEIAPPGPPLEAGAPIGEVARRYLWWVAVVFYTGLFSGVLVVGPAGRLAMRLLAATAGAAAQGRKTEAEEIVGRITVGGTIGLFIFVGIFFGLASGLIYVVLRRWLPRGRLGGLAVGAFLAVVVGTRIDPLRRENPDFDIVGPGWLAVVVYVAMALVQGLALAALAGRISRSLPAVSRRPMSVLPYVPLLILVPTGVAPIALIGALLMTFLVTRVPDAVHGLRSRRIQLAGRMAIVILAVVALPQSVAAVVDIAGRP